MAYPPADLATNYANETEAEDVHPLAHNTEGAAVNTIKDELGDNPSGTFPTVEERLNDVDTVLGATDPFPQYADDADLDAHTDPDPVANPDPHNSVYYQATLMLDPVTGHLFIQKPNGYAHEAHGIHMPAVPGFAEGSVKDFLTAMAAAIPAGSSAFEQDEPFSFPDTLSVQTGKSKYLARVAEDVLGVRATVDTAPVGQDLVFAAKAGGVDIFPTSPGFRNIQATGATNAAGTVMCIPRPTNFAGDRLQILLATQADNNISPAKPSGFADVFFGSPIEPGINKLSTRPRFLDWMKVSAGTEGTARTVSDATITSLTTLTSATAAFTVADQGKSIRGTNIAAGTTILTVVNATTITLSQSCTNGTPLTVTINDCYVISGLTAGRPYCGMALSWKDSDSYSLPAAGLANISGVTDLNVSLVSSITVSGANAPQKNCLAICVVASNGSGVSQSYNVPSGWTLAGGQPHASGLAIVVYFKVITAVGSSGNCGPVSGTGNQYWIGDQLILRPNRPYIGGSANDTVGEFIPTAASPQLAAGAKLSVDIEQVGVASTEGKDLAVIVRRRPH